MPEIDDLKDKRRKIVQEVVETKERIRKLVIDNRSISDLVAGRCRSFVHILRVFQVEIWCALKDWKRIPPIVEVTHATNLWVVDRFKRVSRKLGDLIHKGLTLPSLSRIFWCVPLTRGEARPSIFSNDI